MVKLNKQYFGEANKQEEAWLPPEADSAVTSALDI